MAMSRGEQMERVRGGAVGFKVKVCDLRIEDLEIKIKDMRMRMQ
jgi:hypothetical protein